MAVTGHQIPSAPPGRSSGCSAGSGADGAEAPDSLVRLGGSTRALVPDEALFGEGDARASLYRVETGAVCVWGTRTDGQREIVQMALAGDYVGFGYMPSQVFAARACLDTTVRCLPPESVDEIEKLDPTARAQFNEAINRELAFVRDSLVEAGRREPISRVASLLVALSRAGAQEGGDPAVISDTPACGVIADWIGMSIDALEGILCEMERRGLVEPCPPHGLRVRDIGALLELAEGQA